MAVIGCPKVNGQQMTSSGSEIIFTYSRPHTPIVKSVSPSVRGPRNQPTVVSVWDVWIGLEFPIVFLGTNIFAAAEDRKLVGENVKE